MVNFEDDLRSATIAQLNHYGVKHKANDDLRTLLIKLNTFWSKYIPPKKYTVLLSKELSAKMPSLPEQTQKAILKMEHWISNGVDVNCFQSRGLYGDGSRDYQNTLYGIVHLHLSAKETDAAPVIKKNRFSKPSNYLLYVYFSGNCAYFIDVAYHPNQFQSDGHLETSWTSKSLLKIMVRNWPDLPGLGKIGGAFPCDADGNLINIDDAAIAQLTASHITTCFYIDNAVYMPTFGIMSSGDNAKASFDAIRSVNQAALAQAHYEKNAQKIGKAFSLVLGRNNRPIPHEFDIHFDYVPFLERFAIVERNSGAVWDHQSETAYLFQRTKDS